MSPDQWAASIGLEMGKKVFETLYDQKEQLGGEENYRLAFSMFLGGILSAFVSVGLRHKPKDEVLYTQDELLKFAETNFASIKAMLQNSIANGVQSGILSWSGQEVEYYCLIKPTPDPINDRPC